MTRVSILRNRMFSDGTREERRVKCPVFRNGVVGGEEKNDVSYESKRASGHGLYIRCIRVQGGDNNKRMTAHGKRRKKETAFGMPFVRANPRRVEW